MSYYVSNIIGIRTGGVMSGPVAIGKLRRRVGKVIMEMRREGIGPPVGDAKGNPSHCMSRELVASKGSYVVLAGVFNYWSYGQSSVFAKRLSSELGCEIVHVCWDEQSGHLRCQVWLDGRPLKDVCENSIGRIMRRTTS